MANSGPTQLDISTGPTQEASTHPTKLVENGGKKKEKNPDCKNIKGVAFVLFRGIQL